MRDVINSSSAAKAESGMRHMATRGPIHLRGYGMQLPAGPSCIYMGTGTTQPHHPAPRTTAPLPPRSTHHPARSTQQQQHAARSSSSTQHAARRQLQLDSIGAQEQEAKKNKPARGPWGSSKYGAWCMARMAHGVVGRAGSWEWKWELPEARSPKPRRMQHVDMVPVPVPAVRY
jgi:hypothetical protein